MVSADAHRSSEFFATEYYRGEGFVKSFEFFGVVGIGVFFDGKFFIVGVVAWVDAYFVDVFCRFHGGGREKMYISDKGDVTLCVFECLCDGAEGLGRFFVWGGDANDFATGFSEGEALFDSGLYILGWGGGHGLDANGIFASNGGVADANFSSGYALCVEARDAIGMGMVWILCLC